MLKKALPGFRFPGGAFLPEDETRVMWLRPEDELVVFSGIPMSVAIGKKATRAVPFADTSRLAAITRMRLSRSAGPWRT